MQVLRVLNNNAVLATREGASRVVLLGRGIGFGRKLGDEIDVAAVKHVFVPETARQEAQFALLADEIGLDVMGVAQEITRRACQELGLDGGQALTIALADHINGALHHPHRTGAAYPLEWEVRQLFGRELALAQACLTLIEERLGLALPPQEAVALALHFVTAQFASGDITHTERMTLRITQLLDVVASTLGRPVDPSSMSVARFVTHLRYLFVRLERRQQIDAAPSLLAESLRQVHPEAFRAALRVRTALEMEGAHLTDDEVTYLALHVARLASEPA